MTMLALPLCEASTMTDVGPPTESRPPTTGAGYTERLQRLSSAPWKQRLDVQAPYRWNIRRLHLGRTLDVGCGIGRNLDHLGGEGVGVDHNPTSVAACRARGLEAYTTEEFFSDEYAERGLFDSMLAAHLLEHLTENEAHALLTSYLPCIRPGGTVVLITPQERGHASDGTHVRFMTFIEAQELCAAAGLAVQRQYSFPLPRRAGRAFTYNEFVTVARLPT
jgi:2-polyprenyl-3-methyl-5-hydroxy-6-metoxy-1,4-benzoquinol methylase